MKDKNEKTYLWICGSSASGKNTIISKLRASKRVFNFFNFTLNGHVSFVDLSLGQGKGDILEASGNLIVIKWQRKRSFLIDEIKRETPESKHYAVFLSPPLKKHQAFFYKKYASSSWLKNRLKIMRPLTRKESDNMCIEDRQSNMRWLRKDCPVDYKIVDPMSVM